MGAKENGTAELTPVLPRSVRGLDIFGLSMAGIYLGACIVMVGPRVGRTMTEICLCFSRGPDSSQHSFCCQFITLS